MSARRNSEPIVAGTFGAASACAQFCRHVRPERRGERRDKMEEIFGDRTREYVRHNMKMSASTAHSAGCGNFATD